MKKFPLIFLFIIALIACLSIKEFKGNNSANALVDSQKTIFITHQQKSNSSARKNKKLPACVDSDCDCKDFATQAEAQRVFNASPEDIHKLDRDKDGIACEHLPTKKNS